jgi:hypothetical protein
LEPGEGRDVERSKSDEVGFNRESYRNERAIGNDGPRVEPKKKHSIIIKRS